jgi:predicted secreted hydrolase
MTLQIKDGRGLGGISLWACALTIAGVSGCSSSSGSTSTPDLASTSDLGTTTSLCGLTPTGKVNLPADDAAHSAELEWWYWSGHLQAADGRWFGFEQTFFSLANSGQPEQLVDTALTDIQGVAFTSSSSVGLGAPAQVDNGFTLDVGGQTASGGNGHDVLHSAASGASFDLTLDAQKAPVLHYGNGYVDYVPDGNTYYYSRERMSVSGTVLVNGSPLPVTGQAWFDHQWGQLSTVTQRGWQWFAIQLDDHRELMIYMMLQNGQPTAPVVDIADAECNVTQPDPSEVQVTSTGSWTSPHTGCTYPMGWHVTYRDIDLTITPALEDQEVQDPAQKYWEGASTVTGSATGRAYVELNGYCN